MKHLALALLIAAGCTPAFAGPCVALDYQEMKDMSADDLVREACKARDINNDNSKQAIENLGMARKPFPGAEDNQTQCNGQIDRMLRIIKSKGVDGKLYEWCAQQTQGLKIQSAEPAK